MPDRRPTPPPVIVACVPLSGIDANLLRWTIGNRHEAVQAAVRRGLPPNYAGYLDELIARLEQAGATWAEQENLRTAISELGSPVAEMATDGSSSLTTRETLTSKQAAKLLDLTPRQVLNIADKLGGTKHDGVWLFPRATVLAHLEARSAA